MAKERPLILVVNDDGITAPGIATLVELMKPLGDVYVVAPDSPQSGMGHAITLNATLRCEEVQLHGEEVKAFACSGTPVDCVKLAVNVILPRRPDLCVSGINHGSNSSINVIYSGTMSAAVEGALEGIPSVGFSLLDHAYDANFAPGRPFIKEIAEEVLEKGLPKGVCLNVNIPKITDIKGVKVCRQAQANWEEEFDERIDPQGKKYYWLTGTFKNYDGGTDTDEWALANGFISVVPVQYDVTAHHAISSLNDFDFHVEKK